jgi:outer membrane biosynthesis protein TonB
MTACIRAKLPRRQRSAATTGPPRAEPKSCRLVTIATALLATAALAAAEPTWAADPAPPGTTRGKVHIEALMLPDFPEDLVKPGAPVEVRIRLDLDDEGRVTNVDVESPPTPVDDEVARVAYRWFVIPDFCAGGAWKSQAVETRVIFSIEDGKHMITIKEPQWYGVGSEGPPLREITATGTSTKHVKMQEPLTKPVYPEIAIRRGISYGIAVGVVRFDGTGKPIDLVRLYQWPANVFERSIRDAVMEWRADPNDVDVKSGKTFESCFKVSFRLD